MTNLLMKPVNILIVKENRVHDNQQADTTSLTRIGYKRHWQETITTLSTAPSSLAFIDVMLCMFMQSIKYTLFVTLILKYVRFRL